MKSLHLLFDYINADLRPKYGNADGTEFHIPHGSIIVNISIKDGECKVFAPFLEVNPSAVVPLLRQVASLNFNNMDLAQIYLKEDRLNIEYSCKANEVHPYKMYCLFKEICDTGDKYDDEYVTKFGAKRIYEPIVTPFAASKAETVWQTVQKILADAFEYINYLEGKRLYSLAWDVAAITLRQIDYYTRPQGQLRNDLADGIASMHGKNIPIAELLGHGKVFMKTWQDMDKAQFIADLYETQTFTPDKRRTSLQSIQEKFEREHGLTKENMANSNYINVALGILFVFYDAYYYNNVQDDISAVMVDAMEKSSGKPWEESAKILAAALNKIMDGELKVKKGSFFSRLFK